MKGLRHNAKMLLLIRRDDVLSPVGGWYPPRPPCCFMACLDRAVRLQLIKTSKFKAKFSLLALFRCIILRDSHKGSFFEENAPEKRINGKISS